jgi:hypothetical protein
MFSSFFLTNVAKTTRLHHLFTCFLKIFVVVLSIFCISAETLLQKNRGYTFEGSNDKNCGAFYVLGRP